MEAPTRSRRSAVRVTGSSPDTCRCRAHRRDLSSIGKRARPGGQMATAESSDLWAAVERTAEAVKTGNFAQLMSDITPEAVAQMMQMAPADTGISLTSMPSITGYEIEACPPEGDA